MGSCRVAKQGSQTKKVSNVAKQTVSLDPQEFTNFELLGL